MKLENQLFITLENENLFDKEYNFVKNKLSTLFGVKSKEIEKQLKALQTKKLIKIEEGKVVKTQNVFTEVVNKEAEPKIPGKRDKASLENELLLGTFVKGANGEICVRLRDSHLPVCKVEQTEKVKNSLGKTCVVKINDAQKELSGVVQNIFGLVDDPISENIAIAAKYGFSNKFSQKVIDEARAIPQYVTEKDREGRTDLEHLPIITIDPFNCFNKDDGIYDEPIKNGFRAYIAISDVSHYIKPGSELDKEGLKRSIDAYLGGEVYPMYPPEISNGICSLNENEPRLAVVASCDVTYDGKISNEKVELAVINVRKGYTYEEAEKTHLNQDGFDEINKKTKKHLDFMYQNTKVLEKVFGGMLEFDEHEPQYKFSQDGSEVEDISLSNSEYSHLVVKLRMILKNVIFAKYFKEHKIDGLFRVHDKPTEEKFNALVRKLKMFGINYNLQNSTRSFKGLIEEIKKSPARDYLMMETVRTMTRAKSKASPVDTSHFGLDISEDDWGYMHTTSPIRRESDLINQRQMKASLKNQKSVYSKNTLELIAEHYNAQEKKADEAEHESDEYLACLWAKKHQNKIHEGYISQIDGGFVKVMTSNGTVPVLIFASKLQDEAGEGLKVSKDNMSLVGKKNKYSLGDTIKFKIQDIDLCTRTIFGSNKPELINVQEDINEQIPEKDLTK